MLQSYLLWNYASNICYYMQSWQLCNWKRMKFWKQCIFSRYEMCSGVFRFSYAWRYLYMHQILWNMGPGLGYVVGSCWIVLAGPPAVMSSDQHGSSKLMTNTSDVADSTNLLKMFQTYTFRLSKNAQMNDCKGEETILNNTMRLLNLADCETLSNKSYTIICLTHWRTTGLKMRVFWRCFCVFVVVATK